MTLTWLDQQDNPHMWTTYVNTTFGIYIFLIKSLEVKKLTLGYKQTTLWSLHLNVTTTKYLTKHFFPPVNWSICKLEEFVKMD